MDENRTDRRSGFFVMVGLAGMVKPLLPVMLAAVLMGCAGNLEAGFITVLGGYGLLTAAGIYEGISLFWIVTLLIIFAVTRGILRYAEQACNHYIAFKLLARIRHKVFAALRRLAPAKLDGSRKGNLISIITSDIELLEVFYAHTISPIVIAVLTSSFMVAFIGRMHPLLGGVALCFYLLVGLAIPLVNGKRGGELGQNYRNSFGELNTCVLDNLYGLEEILQYHQQERRMRQMEECTDHLERVDDRLKKNEDQQRIATEGVILFAGVAMMAAASYLAAGGSIDGSSAVIAVIAMTSSFGPVAALSALSNNLHHTLASGRRVLAILEEEPSVRDVLEGADICQGDICCDGVSFSYTDGDEERDTGILENFSAVFSENRIHGILGKSGCGKSTLLKLLMRFYETREGKISYGGEDVNHIKTKTLRRSIAHVTQETFLFHDTIENNLRVAKEDATREEIVEAAKKASIHEFIISLPNGYDTRLAELGDSISGGEKQRIGIARAFLSDADIIFLDEPTSNIDSLNEGIVLKSLEREKENKTILLVSHRKSTMGIADDVLAM